MDALKYRQPDVFEAHRMTIVAAVQKQNEIVIAADTLTYLGSMTMPPRLSTDKKVIRIGNCLIGSSGWGVYGLLLRDFVDGRDDLELNNEKQVFQFFREFWEALDSDYHLVNNNTDSTNPFGQFDSTFLVVSQGGMFRVTSAMSVIRFEQYCAIGSGQEFALGALYSCYDSNQSAADLAQLAVKAAVEFDDACGGEACMESISLK